MPKALLVSVVEDDQFFRESVRRLMRSLGYSVETFPLAADFLASPRPILVTAYPDDDVRARALDDGVVCYLRKPVDEKHLMRCLRAALHSDEPREENS